MASPASQDGTVMRATCNDFAACEAGWGSWMAVAAPNV